MSAGATLLKLQQIDLELARNKSELANMPELKELASKRKTYVKLKSEMTKLYAQRKDLDIELDDLNTTEIQTNNAIEAAKKRHVDGSDYREVQDLENELATLAKRLDKIEHTRKDVVVAHKEALDREARAQAIIAKFEEGVKADTKLPAPRLPICRLRSMPPPRSAPRCRHAADRRAHRLRTSAQAVPRPGRRDHQGQHPHGLPHRAAGIVHE